MIAGALAACGASQEEVRDAKTSGYKADFAIVYSEALAAVRELYPSLIEDARIGVIRTRWHPINVQQGTQDSTTPTTSPTPGGGMNSFSQTVHLRERFWVRFDVNVVGGKPWVVRVHAQASSWKAGEIPTPLKGASVPSWLEGRKSSLEVAIHRRLKKYAVRLKTRKGSEKVAPRRPPDTAKFSGLPPDAARVVAEAEQAAGMRDFPRLRTLMADEFTYSFGDAPSADTAVIMWQADSSILGELLKTLSAGCALDGEKQQVVCPAAFLTDKSYIGYRVGFSRVGPAWKMAFFVAGD